MSVQSQRSEPVFNNLVPGFGLPPCTSGPGILDVYPEQVGRSMYILAVVGRQENVNKVGEQQHWLVAVVARLGGALILVAARQWRPLARRQWLGGRLLG